MSEQNQGQESVTDGEHSPDVHGEDAVQDGEGKWSDDAEHLTIAIYSDPGRTSMWVRRLLKEEAEGWSRGADIILKQELIPLRPDETLDLDAVQKWAQEDEADITLVITEIPRMAGRSPKRAELHFADRLGIVSLPTLGPVFMRRCLRRELRRCVDALVYDSVDEARQKGGFTSRVEDQEGHETVYTTPSRFFPARLWTTLGMVVANEPLWSLRKLSGVFSAAAATGAFGIFFTTIWEMATFLPAWRLAAISVIAITIMVLWLILANRLWDRPKEVGGRREAFMYNASTLASLTVSVGLVYIGLFCTIIGMGLMLISPDFMSQTVGEGEFYNYVEIAWLSASMGTVAGAIGSNFDDDADLKKLTQGSREFQRYPRDSEQR
ncbi:hypothetical protein HGQ17_12115 [Nesterenkonia sp. MY13]|uniref:5,10-methylene-tetrahydrofolate dehydrogenase n=1 Tax=Nesterenkonia sedimenti TaxID=1463632 RepID=A0A7X8TMG6_9MICC|nr:hypothetical protein [Nesterenkonia sedimenti]NLS10723.1 hypothetical protein [Nesterenkonia sedimenti]